MEMNDYIQSVARTRERLPAEARSRFDTRFSREQKNPVIALGLSLWLGVLGADRLYVGKLGSGFAKMVVGIISLTLEFIATGELFTFELGEEGNLELLLFAFLLRIWVLVDWFNIAGMARETSRRRARAIAMDLGADIP